MNERRQWPRYDTMLPCVTRTGDASAKGFVVNISKRGTAIESSQAPETDSEVEVTFFDHWGKEIRLSGKVVHLNVIIPEGESKSGYGVQTMAIHSGATELDELRYSLAELERDRQGAIEPRQDLTDMENVVPIAPYLVNKGD